MGYLVQKPQLTFTTNKHSEKKDKKEQPHVHTKVSAYDRIVQLVSNNDKYEQHEAPQDNSETKKKFVIA